jgi:hypothetical protein
MVARGACLVAPIIHINGSSAADEADNLELVAVGKRGRGVMDAPYDLAIALDGDAPNVDVELLQQVVDRRRCGHPHHVATNDDADRPRRCWPWRRCRDIPMIIHGSWSVSGLSLGVRTARGERANETAAPNSGQKTTKIFV